jgi:hypothetical protein
LTSYNDGSVAMNTTYRYRVLAIDTDNNWGGWTTPASATTPFAPDTTAPPTPDLSGSRTAPQTITLTWPTVVDTGGSGLAGYYLWRFPQASCSTGWSIYQTLGPGATSFVDSGLAPLTWHRYQIQAFDNAGNVSVKSIVISIQTQ